MNSSQTKCCGYGQDLKGVEIYELIKSSKSWDFATLPPYKTGTPEITISRITISPGGEIPLHKHPIISCCVMLKGKMIVISDNNEKFTINEGMSAIETVNKWHSAYNPSDNTSELIAFYAGTTHTPNTILAKDNLNPNSVYLEKTNSQSISVSQHLCEFLTNIGLDIVAGVTGGGIIHLLKNIQALNEVNCEKPSNLKFILLGEYLAGFFPIGHYLATGRPAASIATTGAATKLLSCGLSDAKLHNIPALYVVPTSPPESHGFSPLQDTSEYGLNIAAQLRAELPESVIQINDINNLSESLNQVRSEIKSCRPVVLLINPTVLTENFTPPLEPRDNIAEENSLTDSKAFDKATEMINKKRITLLVCEEMSRCESAQQAIQELSYFLGAATIYSINGANAVSRDNPYSYGYVSFGGNDKALSLLNHPQEEDLLIILGDDLDEYTTGITPLSFPQVLIMTNNLTGYGPISGSYSHRFSGLCHLITGNLKRNVNQLIRKLKNSTITTIRHLPINGTLNNKLDPFDTKPEYINLRDFYVAIDKLWREESIGFDDVCLSYKDRQYVTQRPNNNCPFYSLYRGSAMGGVLGAAIGAKFGAPEKSVFVFTGDGCFRLFGGNLAEARDLGINVFLLNNGCYGIVEHGLKKILTDIPEHRFHSKLATIDYESVSQGYGWSYRKINADLSNLEQIMTECYQSPRSSTLIELPIDPRQDLGQNPRLKNL